MSKYLYRIIKPPSQMGRKADIQLSIVKKEEVCHSFEDYSDNIDVFCRELEKRYSHICLTGFTQKDIDLILPYIASTVKTLQLFKCPQLESFDFLSKCTVLETVDIYYNQRATSLWNIKDNTDLHTLVIDSCNKLSDFSSLENSHLKHLSIWGCNYLSCFTPKIKIDDLSIFATMPNLETLHLAIKKNENLDKDLEDLSKLKNLKEFSIQDRYFSAEQLTRLKSALINTSIK